ncbi:nucleotide exchange factor GrpE [Brevibacterium sp. S111]|jgi:molecular chaperone GrpE|uniref:nucleotide exchange factor GrpE n=1 Tax=unclassified Brevibacterium TaxID=2614124 RepID=UPI00108212AE|nr:nucleotide exchange factor GrpE [Brevibacterium sp. S111]TGD10985.1 nucleotide exchange factor GrpE [Brevibacterium sp. S111]
MTAEGNDESSEEPGFTFSDKRRVDPNTGEVRPEADAQSASAEAGEEPTADPNAEQAETASAADASDLGVDIPTDASGLEDTEPADEPEPGSEAAAHLADLKRINAEYAAYRMRAERERERAALGGTIKVVEALIPVLDEVKLARENGDVTGPFETHVDKLVDSLAKLGVEQYGEVGEEFDPNVHEALMQQPSDEVESPTIFLVMQPGYRIGERIIRAARVGVQQPED